MGIHKEVAIGLFKNIHIGEIENNGGKYFTMQCVSHCQNMTGHFVPKSGEQFFLLLCHLFLFQEESAIFLSDITLIDFEDILGLKGRTGDQFHIKFCIIQSG